VQTLSDIESVRGGPTPPWRTLFLTGLALALYLLAGPAPEAWVYDRMAIADGELWRLMTGHLVHADGSHALWDIAALALLGAIASHSANAVAWSLPISRASLRSSGTATP